MNIIHLAANRIGIKVIGFYESLMRTQIRLESYTVTFITYKFVQMSSLFGAGYRNFGKK